MENFLVCRPKIEGVYTKKVATEKHWFTASKEAYQQDPVDNQSEIGYKLSKNHIAFQ